MSLIYALNETETNIDMVVCTDFHAFRYSVELRDDYCLLYKWCLFGQLRHKLYHLF